MGSADKLHVRVWVTDIWDNVEMEVSPDHSVARLKQEALERTCGGVRDTGEFQVKFRGGLVLNEKLTLSDLDVPDHAPFVIVPTRRRPVR